jgi:hypothetical protein
MVARGFWNAPTLLTRRQGCVIGLVAATPAAAIVIPIAGRSPWWTFTLAVACLASGAVIGSTIGRSLAARPTLPGVLSVAAIAVILGDIVAAALIPLGIEQTGPPNEVILWWAALAFYGYLLFALPGVLLGVAIARRTLPGAS